MGHDEVHNPLSEQINTTELEAATASASLIKDVTQHLKQEKVRVASPGFVEILGLGKTSLTVNTSSFLLP